MLLSIYKGIDDKSSTTSIEQTPVENTKNQPDEICSSLLPDSSKQRKNEKLKEWDDDAWDLLNK